MGKKKGLNAQDVLRAYHLEKSIKGTARRLGVHKSAIQYVMDRNPDLFGGIRSSNLDTNNKKISERFKDHDGKHRRFVVTSAQNATAIDKGFVGAMRSLCEHIDAKLMILPYKYRTPKSPQEAKALEDMDWWDPEIAGDMVFDNLRLSPNLVLMGRMHISATAINPFSSLNNLSRGSSMFIGSPQLRFQSLPRIGSEPPITLAAPGTCTIPDYSDSKSGFIADGFHTNSCFIIEFERDGRTFHQRDCTYDGKGMYDMCNYYTADGVERHDDACEAIQPGDLHALFLDPKIKEALFTGKDSCTSRLRPNALYLHDALDFYSGSHHHDNSVFTKYAKHHSGMNDVRSELDLTLSTIREISKGVAKVYVVDSNHNRHFTQWLEKCDPKRDPQNALVYHKMMYLMLEKTSMTNTGATHPNPFELYAKASPIVEGMDITFLSGGESHMLNGVEKGMHGDRGTSGSRGSVTQFSRLPVASDTGHNHTDHIMFDARSAGKCTYDVLEYTYGSPTTWTSGFIVSWKNGKRQNARVINGSWFAVD